MCFSCKKNNDTVPTPPTPPKPDTLTAGWVKTNVSGGFSDVFFQNSSTGYAAGSNLYKTTDGGTNWTKINSLFQGANISVTGDGKVFYVSYTDSIKRSVNGGISFSPRMWEPLHLYRIFILLTITMVSRLGVQHFIKRSTAEQIGHRLVLHQDCYSLQAILLAFLPAPATGGSVIRPIFSGQTAQSAAGQRLYLPVPRPRRLVRSVCLQRAHQWFTLAPTTAVFMIPNGGSNFSQLIQLPKGTNGSGSYLDLHFVDANTGYACYTSRIYKTTDAGNSWQPVVSLGSGSFVEIHFTDATHGWGCTAEGAILKFN